MRLSINRLGFSEVELSFSDGTLVLFSYNTPVAARVPNGQVFRTSQKHSKTTTKHINGWITKHGFRFVVEKPQEFFDNLLEIERKK